MDASKRRRGTCGKSLQPQEASEKKRKGETFGKSASGRSKRSSGRGRELVKEGGGSRKLLKEIKAKRKGWCME